MSKNIRESREALLETVEDLQARVEKLEGKAAIQKKTSKKR